MMYNHICRAKRIDNGEWAYGYVARTDYLTNVFELICPELITIHVHQDTICRSIGKEDKNGNLIFENDIIDASSEWWNASGPAGHDSPIILVEWNDDICGFDPFANYDCDCGVYIHAEHCVVLGNKFDNTELMEEQ